MTSLVLITASLVVIAWQLGAWHQLERIPAAWAPYVALSVVAAWLLFWPARRIGHMLAVRENGKTNWRPMLRRRFMPWKGF